MHCANTDTVLSTLLIQQSISCTVSMLLTEVAVSALLLQDRVSNENGPDSGFYYWLCSFLSIHYCSGMKSPTLWGQSGSGKCNNPPLMPHTSLVGLDIDRLPVHTAIAAVEDCERDLCDVNICSIFENSSCCNCVCMIFLNTTQ